MTLQEMWETIREQATMFQECTTDGGNINCVAMIVTRTGDVLIYHGDGPGDLDTACLKLAEHLVDIHP